MQSIKFLCVLFSAAIFTSPVLIVNARYESITATFDYTATYDANAAFTVDVSQSTETAIPVRNIDFETPNIPAGTSLEWNTDPACGSVNGGVLSVSSKVTATLADNIYGDYTATFHIKTGNRAQDRVLFKICNGYFLELRGTSTGHGATDESGTAISYAAAISNGSLKDGNGYGMYDVTDIKSGNPTAGCWVKLNVTDKTVNVWLIANKNWTGQFPVTPTLTYTAHTDFEKISSLSCFSEESNSLYIDDLKLECETFTYQNNYDQQAYNPEKAMLSTDETTGNTMYTHVFAESDNLKRSLFAVPENYEMQFFVYSDGQLRIYLKNDINLLITDTGETHLCDGVQILETATVGTVSYVKTIFKGEQLTVYINNKPDFETQNMVFNHTFEGLTTTNNTIGVCGYNTTVSFDNFKVYDLETVDTQHKQIILNGTDIKLLDVLNGNSGEIGSYTLPHTNGTYRISIVNANDLLTVYVNGETVLETPANAAKQVVFDGEGAPFFTFDISAPTVIIAGDLDYNQGVDANDLIIMKKILLGIDKTTYVTKAVNADGDFELKTDIRDLIRIKKIIAKAGLSE